MDMENQAEAGAEGKLTKHESNKWPIECVGSKSFVIHTKHRQHHHRPAMDAIYFMVIVIILFLPGISNIFDIRLVRRFLLALSLNCACPLSLTQSSVSRIAFGERGACNEHVMHSAGAHNFAAMRD